MGLKRSGVSGNRGFWVIAFCAVAVFMITASCVAPVTPAPVPLPVIPSEPPAATTPSPNTTPPKTNLPPLTAPAPTTPSRAPAGYKLVRDVQYGLVKHLGLWELTPRPPPRMDCPSSELPPSDSGPYHLTLM